MTRSSMNRRLLLMRHAKSSWGDESLPDHDRPLSGRGRRAAEVVGAHLRARELLPDLVLCSSSARTRETFDRLGLDGIEVSFDERLYGAGGDELLGRLRELGTDVVTVLLIGHNPGVQELALELVRPARTPEAARMGEKFPTGALAVFGVRAAWVELSAATARLETFVTPRDLSAAR